MWQRFTERARRTVFCAQEEAGRLGESYVSTEHLLLGLVRETDSVAVKVLDRLGVGCDRIRSEIERQATTGDGKMGADMQLTPRAKRVIDLAYDEARKLGNNYIGTEHFLLGLIREGEGMAARVLAKLGIEYERVLAEVNIMQDNGNNGEFKPVGKSTGEVSIPRSLYEEMRSFFSGQAPTEAAFAPPVNPEKDKLMRDLTSSIRKLMNSDQFNLKGKSLLSIADLSKEQLDGLLVMTAAMDATHKAGRHLVHYDYPKSLAMIFEKPSLRTRVTFELGFQQLGGLTVVLGPAEIGLGTRETVPDAARNLERWADIIMARVFDHNTLIGLRDNCRIPVINALSDVEHPCQALADLYTIQQKKGKLEGIKLAWVGDGNNVLHSLMLAGALSGMTINAACPEGYMPDAAIVRKARELAGESLDIEPSFSRIRVYTDPAEAVRDADAVYTDVWTSMGQEAEKEARLQVFRPYQVNAALMAHAKPNAIFMHCLPAHRGEEVSEEVIDGAQSVVFDEAENRLHAQKAVMAALLGES